MGTYALRGKLLLSSGLATITAANELRQAMYQAAATDCGNTRLNKVVKQ